MFRSVRLSEMIRRLSAREDGATMVEYGIMAALIAGVCIAVVTTLGTQTLGLFETLMPQF